MLEEAILYLLRASGYRPLESAPQSRHPSPIRGSLVAGGLWLSGRGSEHQIDAIADFALTLPFTHPHRLLVEAKSYSRERSIGVRFIRNAVGVLKDVQEYWVGREGVPPKGRHHYQYAVFSTSGFTDVAQKYAFAHDIFLVPLASSQFISQIVDLIQRTIPAHFESDNPQSISISPSQLRKALRREILHVGDRSLDQLTLTGDALVHLRQFANQCRRVNQAFISVVGDRFPLFLVPSPEFDVFEVQDFLPVRIIVEEGNWYVFSEDHGRIFSFDIPPELFEIYDQWSDLSPHSIYSIKTRFLTAIRIIATRDERLRIITLELDQEWLEGVRARLAIVKRYKEKG